MVDWDKLSATAAGSRGQLRVGYQTAATIGAWRVQLAPTKPRTYHIEATIDRWDPYWRSQGPWALRLEVGEIVWEWPHVTPMTESEALVVFAVRCLPTVIRFAQGTGGPS